MKRHVITPAEQALIDAHLAEKGVIHCPFGAMATVPEYVWKESKRNKNEGLRRADGKSEWHNDNSGYYKNIARAKRLRQAEQ